MDKTLSKSRIAWPFLLWCFVRIVNRLPLLAAIFVFGLVISTYRAYQNEKAVVAKIEEAGGIVSSEYCGLSSVPKAIRDRLPYWNRVRLVLMFEQTMPSELFSELRFLRNLDISRSDFTDDGMEHLKWLTKLEYLKLSGTGVTSAGLKQIKGLTHLKLLELDYTQVTDAGLIHLKELNNLDQLTLNHAQITDAGLKHLKGLRNLDCLELNHTQITDIGLEHLKDLRKLEFLDIGGTQVTDAGA